MGPVGSVDGPLVERAHGHWLEPVPNAAVLPPDADPAELAILRESIRLAFVAALQHLPAKQRAALLLAEVLGWTTAEVAEALETTVPAVNSALQRARATMAGRELGSAPALTAAQADLIDRYVTAFERYDVDQLAGMLCADAVLSMPPYSMWLRGPATIRAWLAGRGSGCRGSRLIATEASGSPAWGQYRPDEAGGHRAWALVVLELSGESIAGWNSFLAVDALFPRFGLPLVV